MNTIFSLGHMMTTLVLLELILFTLMCGDTVRTGWERRHEDRLKWVKYAEWMVPIMYSGHVVEWIYRSYRRIVGAGGDDWHLFTVDLYLGLTMVVLWICVRKARHQVIQVYGEHHQLSTLSEELVKLKISQERLAAREAELILEQDILAHEQEALVVEKAVIAAKEDMWESIIKRLRSLLNSRR